MVWLILGDVLLFLSGFVAGVALAQWYAKRTGQYYGGPESICICYSETLKWRREGRMIDRDVAERAVEHWQDSLGGETVLEASACPLFSVVGCDDCGVGLECPARGGGRTIEEHCIALMSWLDVDQGVSEK